MASENRDPMHDACIREIVDLHVFFQGWLDGSIPDRSDAFVRFTGAAAPDFTLIGPDGGMSDFAATAAWIQGAHGARPGFRLWTTDHVVHYRDGKLALATYREWQTLAGVTTVRFSTAVFQAEPSAPNGVVWLHVHETWITTPAQTPN